jgi:hypothetical protein
LWNKSDHRGSFDESGYTIDHKVQYRAGRTDDTVDELQALCVMCYRVKMMRHATSGELIVEETPKGCVWNQSTIEPDTNANPIVQENPKVSTTNESGITMTCKISKINPDTEVKRRPMHPLLFDVDGW